MRALVTGADGFLGAHLCRELQAGGHEVIGATLNRRGYTCLDALGVTVRLEYGDVLERDYLRRLVNEYESEWLFHLAGVSIVRIAEADAYRAIQTNAMGTLNALDAARHGPVEAVLVASSDKAYGDHNGVAYTEDMALQPHGVYELSKALADMLALRYPAPDSTRVIVARCANMYGPGDLQWSRLVPNSCRRIVRGEPPEVHPGAWGYEREWLHVTDAARAYIHLAERGAGGEAYNVGSGERATAGEVARRLAVWGGLGGKAVESEWHIREIPAQRLDCSKIRATGWLPMVRLDNGLAATLSWYGDYLRGQA